jgi:glycosyltransferase involved in cell wall biosynthesis
MMRWHGSRTEAQLLKSTDLMFTVNESLKAHFTMQYGFNSIEVLMNLPYTYPESKELGFNFKAHFCWPADSIIVLYQGALNSGRGLELMIESFRSLDNKFCLVVLGDGMLRERLIFQTRALGLESRIGFYEAVPLSELPRFTKGADIGMNLLETYNLSKQLASPNKLFEYIHACIPVVASRTIENQKVFDNFNIGELCENTPQDVAEKIKIVAKNKDLYTHDLNLAKTNFCWEKQEVKFLDILKSI